MPNPKVSSFAIKYIAPALALRIRNILLYPKLAVNKKTTDLVVEGFPRAANTYVYEVAKQLILKAGLPRTIAHHLHTSDQVQFALKYSIPLAFVIRNPSDSIASLCTRRNIDIHAALISYIKYHTRVFKYLYSADPKNFTVLEFERVTTSNQTSWIEDLKRLLSIESVFDYETICQNAKLSIYRRNEALANKKLMSNLPNRSRKDLLSKAKDLVISAPGYDDAYKLFEAILKSLAR